jgi:mannose-6-phosphate isomerase-like protein (cupin superfamily)
MSRPEWAPSLEDAERAALASDRRFGPMFRRGSLLLGLYAPDRVDPQTPHVQDEVYIVVSGTGEFVRSAGRVTFGPGDVLFVPAHEEHRFENFTHDFQAWVVFYGPDGGEGDS